MGGQRGVSGFQSGHATPHPGERLNGGKQSRLFSYAYAGALYFCVRLLAVAPIGKEPIALGPYQQHSGAAGEPAQIADVGQMGDQEDIQPGVA
jgi:hypothetical protein